jgi:hypothetical protein
LSEWRRLAGYCGACATWNATLPHANCARQATVSAISLDHEEFLLTCDQCHEVWLIEDTQMICQACGYVQPIAMSDCLVQIGPDDRVLAADGPVVYILLGSGTLLITHRGCVLA